MSEQELIVIENPAAVFVDNGVEDVLEMVRAKVLPLVFDVATNKGRTECASVAAKVSRTKTLLDGAGKDLVSDWKTKAKVVDQQRKLLRDSLDEIKSGVRAPLTAWEEEKKRQAELREKQIAHVRQLGQTQDMTGRLYSSEELEQRLVLLSEIPEPDDWFGERLDQAREVYGFAKNNLGAAKIVRIQEEQKAKAEAQRLEAERKAEEERRIVELVEREKAEAVAEVQRKAEANQAAAVAAERKLVQQEIEDKRIADLKAKDRANSLANSESKMKLRRSVHSDIRQSLFGLGLDLPTVDAVEDAMIKGRIPHVWITY